MVSTTSEENNVVSFLLVYYFSESQETMTVGEVKRIENRDRQTSDILVSVRGFLNVLAEDE